jgi:hypothetical protein
LVIITNLSTLLPLPFLGWLPSGDPQAEQSSNDFAPGEAPIHNSGGLIESGITPSLVPEFAINNQLNKSQEEC